jgi:hypothetical protein
MPSLSISPAGPQALYSASRDKVVIGISDPCQGERDVHAFTTSAKIKAVSAAAIQQALVSGLTWGCVDKVGLAVAGVAFPGSVAAASIANVLGGVALGPAHLLIENLIVKLRHRIGHGAEFNPDPNDGRGKYYREGVFIGCFYAASGIKSVVKVATGAGPWVGLGIDVASSLLAGTGAQLLTAFRKPIVESGANIVYPVIGTDRPAVRPLALKKVALPEITVREMATRGVAGLAVGGMTTVSELGSINDETIGDLLRVASHDATKSFVALSTWFGIRSMLPNVLDKMSEFRVPERHTSTCVVPEGDHAGVAEPVIESGDVETEDVFHDASEVVLKPAQYLPTHAVITEDAFHDALDTTPNISRHLRNQTVMK